MAAVRGGRLAIGEIHQLKGRCDSVPDAQNDTLARDGHTTDVGSDERVVPAPRSLRGPAWSYRSSLKGQLGADRSARSGPQLE